MYFISLIRLKQWTKNLLCFAGVLFGNNLFDYELWFISFQTFLVFCLTSSSIYIINDISDIKYDAIHPKKKFRPMASGKISIGTGFLVALIFITTALFFSYKVNFALTTILIFYIINNIFYNILFKKMPIADIFSISFGFILRLMAGIYCIGETPTAWIVLCTMFLALFLGFSKRKAEFVKVKSFKDYNLAQRPVLKLYTEKLIDDMVSNSSIGAIFTYALFTTTSGENSTLVVTVPIVYYAISYYKVLLFEKGEGEEPESILIKDRTILSCVIIWFSLYILIKYLDLQFFAA